MVLVVSFVALAVLWPEPKLTRTAGARFPAAWGGFSRAARSRSSAGPSGSSCWWWSCTPASRECRVPTANFAPTFIYVIFWLALVPLSVLFGDVFRAFNPWRAIGRAVAGVAKLLNRGRLPAPLPYPEKLGRWPAALGIFAFAALELVAANGDQPENLAIATLIYSAATFIGMALYGIEAWMDRGEAFSVYFNLYSRLAPVGLGTASWDCASRCRVSPPCRPPPGPSPSWR